MARSNGKILALRTRMDVQPRPRIETSNMLSRARQAAEGVARAVQMGMVVQSSQSIEDLRRRTTIQCLLKMSPTRVPRRDHGEKAPFCYPRPCDTRMTADRN